MTATPTPTGLGARLQRGASRLVASPLFWIAFLAVAMGWPIVRTLSTDLPPVLPVLGTVPPFAVPSQRGEVFRSEELRGRTWVAHFIFTRCADPCLRSTETLIKVRHRSRNLGRAFHLVTFSTDPDYDTPERLAAYAQKHKASPRMWTLLSGAPKAVREAVSHAFRVSRKGAVTSAELDRLLQGSHLLLVDPWGRVRGFYDVARKEEIDALLRDAGLVANRGG